MNHSAARPSPAGFNTKVVPMTGATQKAVSRKDAAEYLGVSDKTIERLIDRGDLKAFKVLGQWRIMISDMLAFIEQQRSAQMERTGNLDIGV